MTPLHELAEKWRKVGAQHATQADPANECYGRGLLSCADELESSLAQLREQADKLARRIKEYAYGTSHDNYKPHWLACTVTCHRQLLIDSHKLLTEIAAPAREGAASRLEEARWWRKYIKIAYEFDGDARIAQLEREAAAERPAQADAERLAQRFHETYERLAPSFGYETRKASAKPWADVPEQNKRLMIAVCAELLRASQPDLPKGRGSVSLDLEEYQ